MTRNIPLSSSISSSAPSAERPSGTATTLAGAMAMVSTSPNAHATSGGEGGDVDILILGAGWTGTFLIPMLKEGGGLRWAATTRDGHDETIPFTFDPESKDHERYGRLPLAKTVLITFPLKGSGQSKLLTNLYNESHAGAKDTTNWIQLGSTLIYKDQKWTDYKSSYDKTDERAIAEDELLSLFSTRACILNLAGLYGGQRQLRHWLPRVARSKEQAAAKGAVHMVHGNDVSRAILGAHFSLLKEASADQALESPKPQTVGGWHWPITDLHCYDWWDLFMQFGSYARENAIAGGVSEAILKGANPESLTYEKWVLELMDEQGVKALPRDKERNGMGRLVDGRAFWDVVGSWPEEGRADRRE